MPRNVLLLLLHENAGNGQSCHFASVRRNNRDAARIGLHSAAVFLNCPNAMQKTSNPFRHDRDRPPGKIKSAAHSLPQAWRPARPLAILGEGNAPARLSAETFSEKISFKKPFEFQRCLVVTATNPLL
jgi:hypothetical protein